LKGVKGRRRTPIAKLRKATAAAPRGLCPATLQTGGGGEETAQRRARGERKGRRVDARVRGGILWMSSLDNILTYLFVLFF
jgi:hypothetical protein